MKILLIGEFSSLHKNLKEGLVELGHEVVIAADSCGWMDIKPDVNFTSPRGGLLGKIESYIVNPFKALPSLTGFDVVQFMSPLVLHSKTLPLVKRFYRHLVRHNGKSFLLSAGDDCYFAKIANVELAYSPWPDAQKHDGFDPSMWHNEKVVQWNDELVGMVNGVIPILYEYAYGYRARQVKNLIPTIPIPMNLKAIRFHDNIVGDKVRFFHGLNRYGFKGTSYIEKAFEIVAKRYPNDVQCTIAGKMPLEQYLKLISEVNVSLDQTNSYSYAMNAIYSLAMGHVVMSGCEPECLAEFRVASSPVINIVPDSKQIVEQMERVLENRKRITEWGREGRRYAEQLHDHVAVAQRYLDAWGAA